MANPALALSRLSFVGLGKEGAGTLGTFAAPTVYIPGLRFSPEDIPQFEDDVSMEGNTYKLQGVIAGEKDAQFAIDANCYFELLGHIFVAAGYADTVSTGRSVADAVTNATTTVTSATAAFVAGDVGAAITGTNIPAGAYITARGSATSITISVAATGSGSGGSLVIAGGAGAYGHVLKLTNTAPPSYSLTDFNQLTASTGTRGYPGCMLDQADITVNIQSLIKAALQFKGWPSASQSKPTPSYPALPAGHGWQSAYSIAGVVNKHILEAGYSLKQNVETIHTGQNSQAPWDTQYGEREASLKLKVAPEDETEFLLMLNNTQPSIVTTITSPSGSPAPLARIISGVSAAKKAPLDRSGKYAQFNIDVDLVGNSTDGGPLQAYVQNGTAAAY